MATLTAPHPLVDELMKTEGKAEIVNGRIVKLMATGGKPNIASLRIAASLLLHSDSTGNGWALGDNGGFLCDLPHRKSFSPDAAYYFGPEPDMSFLPEPPVFAVEVRSENDYGHAAERAIRDKIADYFAAGTLVVWDVDLQHDEVVAKYMAPDFRVPQTFRRGEEADAEPAVPGWKMRVDDLFPRVR